MTMEFQKECFENEKEHGFHDGSHFYNDISPDIKICMRPTCVFYRKIALLMTEMAELVESFRKGELYSPSDKKELHMSNSAEELGDIQIRLNTLSEFLHTDVEGAARRKHEYNKTRPYMHEKNS